MTDSMAAEGHFLEGVVNGKNFLGHFNTTLEEFGNEAFFLRLGLPSTLIRHEHGVTAAFQSFSCGWKEF